MVYRQGCMGRKSVSRPAAKVSRQVLGVSQMRSPQNFCLRGRRRVKKSSQVAETAHMLSATSLQAECIQISFFHLNLGRSIKKFSMDIFSKPMEGLVRKGVSPVPGEIIGIVAASKRSLLKYDLF